MMMKLKHLLDLGKAILLAVAVVILLYSAWIIAIVIAVIGVILVLKLGFTEYRKHKDSLKREE
jgi:Flp pilus assembly protein TadB